ncbi:MAG: hypothetical protein V7K50_27975 [Nostoc sp.]|uniref:hypothetical protein n=1 Tax=Nostoc sp. TaxID=1180 RepID=UPI002FFB4EEA
MKIHSNPDFQHIQKDLDIDTFRSEEKLLVLNLSLEKGFSICMSSLPAKIMFKVENWLQYWPTGTPR